MQEKEQKVLATMMIILALIIQSISLSKAQFECLFQAACYSASLSLQSLLDQKGLLQAAGNNP
jgi:hypothetical protein